MTDRESLELAARAAGYSFKWGKDIEKQDQRDHAHHGDCEHNYLGDSCPRK